MTLSNASTLRFIATHRNGDVRALALQASRHPDVDMPFAIRQISGWQVARAKVPTWAQTDGIRYPQHLSMEQCSSELTARYKATVPARLRAEGRVGEAPALCDLTGGFGIDCSMMAPHFARATYVERLPELCELARHNFPLLGLPHIAVVNADAVEHLHAMDEVDLIFVDPARRDGHGGKTVAVADCEPDVSALEDLLLRKARYVWVKLSPMLDLTLALHTLNHVAEAHIVSADGECKELLLLLSRDTTTDAYEVPIHCVNLTRTSVPAATFNSQLPPLTFTRATEQAAPCPLASTPGAYLYEPNASILKAGAYRSVAHIYKVEKLHPNSHLYTSAELCPHFPGRTFRIEGSYGFGKADLKALRQALGEPAQANLTVRNFPASVADLRRRLKLREGGHRYLFATTLHDGERRLLLCSKI